MWQQKEKSLTPTGTETPASKFLNVTSFTALYHHMEIQVQGGNSEIKSGQSLAGFLSVNYPGSSSSTWMEETRVSKTGPPARSQPVYRQNYIPAHAVPRGWRKLGVAKAARRRSISLSRKTFESAPASLIARIVRAFNMLWPSARSA
jgi:hypothetical protein